MSLFVLQQLLQRNIKSFDMGSHSSMQIIVIFGAPMYLKGATRNRTFGVFYSVI
jgi:hypothetical protein